MKYLAFATVALSLSAGAQTCSNMSLGQMANLNGFRPFGTSDAWNTPVASASADLVNTAGFLLEFGAGHLHFDATIPYTVVDTTTHSTVPVTMTTYPGDSDIMPYPLGSDVAVEGSPANCSGAASDQHALVVDRNTCFVYETYQTSSCTEGGSTTWTAANGAVWDLNNNEARPYGWTSADAAGLPIFPGLVKYEEVASGTIKHALRFTLAHTKNDANGGFFTAPASHASGNNWGTFAVIGMRFRLRSDFDISGYSAHNQTILTAMKQYGLILADNGSSGFFQGTPDSRWSDDDLNGTKAVPLSAFEVVSTGNPVVDVVTAPTGASPTITSFSASSANVTAGSAVTLSWTTANDSYDFIDTVGPVRNGSVVVKPTATTTYTLNSTNHFGRTTRAVTVQVSAAAASTSTSSSTSTSTSTSASTSNSTTGTQTTTSATTPSAPAAAVPPVAPVVPAAATPAWIRVASEGDSVTVPSGASVRYGVPSQGAFDAVKVFRRGATFPATNSYFGADPLYGVVKEVDVLGSTTGVVVNGVAISK